MYGSAAISRGILHKDSAPPESKWQGELRSLIDKLDMEEQSSISKITYYHIKVCVVLKCL